ncbi:unnamed protein product [Prorocentrum cordatum]|uniref:Uncharacterized protein n=1 Tax=Prorocentrum cordatum TaxID=2364126 RepID=A0ABN9PQI5_9DINO|nr:unnamed protein product [Polarella glacialis]
MWPLGRMRPFSPRPAMARSPRGPGRPPATGRLLAPERLQHPSPSLRARWRSRLAPAPASAASPCLPEVHDAKVVDLLRAMPFMPFESACLTSLTGLKMYPGKIAASGGLKDIEEYVDKLQSTDSLLKQLCDSIKVAARDLLRAVKQSETDLKKDRANQQKKEQATRDAAAKVMERREMPRLSSVKDSLCFKLNLTEAGHPSVQAMTEEAWGAAKAKSPDAFYSEPRLLQNPRALVDLCAAGPPEDASPRAVFATALGRCKDAFPLQTEALRSGKIVAPVLGPMGRSEVAKAFAQYVGENEKVSSRLPAYAGLANRMHMYGSLADAIHFGTEANFMATLWFQKCGTTRFLMVSPTSVKGMSEGNLTWDTLRHAIKDMAEKDAKAYHSKGFEIFTAVVEPNMMLMVPAGWVIATASVVQAREDQVAVQATFLPKICAKSAAATLQCAKAFNPPAASLKVIDTLLDVCTMAQDEQEAAI